MEEASVLSVFDGMACGMLAMQSAGIKVGRYVAYEIEKYAIKTASHNFPMIEQRGDVFEADFTEFEGFDFLIGGSPCTYWSIAKSVGRETVASGMGWELFQQYVRALHEAKPKFFVYENNKSMSKAIRASIDEAFGFEAICINSALVSAQSRQRLYWVGKRNEDGTYSKVDIEQPEDRGILLKDILESGYCWREKANCLCGNRGGTSLANDLTQSRHNYAAEPVGCRCRGRVDKDWNGYAKYECRDDEKANTLDTNTTNGAMVSIPVRFVIEKFDAAVDKFGYIPQMRNPYNNAEITDKAPTQTAQCGRQTTSSTVIIFDYAIPCEWDENGKPIKAMSGADGKAYTVYEVKDGYIAIKGKRYAIKLKDGFYIIRKLTVRECMRLQTVPEWFEFPVSDTHAFRQLGNGWTVEIISHLLRGCVASFNF